MKEDFVSYNLAVKLKEKDYPQNICFRCYFVGDDKVRGCSVGDVIHRSYKGEKHLIAAPTISQVLKWLREEHKLYLCPSVITEYENDYAPHVPYWSFIVVNIETGDAIYREYERADETRCEDFEQAALAGIEYTLDNLI